MSVLVAGAGPAGSRLAELLSLNGVRVILVERLSNPNQEVFSSAALPINAIDEQLIPQTSISHYWNTWQIFTPGEAQFQWKSSKSLGVVLDFGLLRDSLWDKARKSGVELLSGHTVKNVCSLSNYAEVEICGPNGNLQKRKVNWVVDATGSRRKLISNNKNNCQFNNNEYIKGSGVEWLIQGDQNSNQIWGEKLTFCIGTKWIEHGYGWIFPMRNNQLKVGICKLPPGFNKGLDTSLDGLKRLMQRFELDKFHVLDQHGGFISSSIKRNEPHLYGRLVGVGDAISTANLLGGEGIRYALSSASVLAPLLLEANGLAKRGYEKSCKPLLTYKKELRKKFGWRWVIANKLAKRTWWGLSNEVADKRLNKLIVGLHRSASAEDVSALLFDYRFERYGFRLFPYLMDWR